MTGSRSLRARRLIATKKPNLTAALPGALASTLAALTLLVAACATEPPVAAEDTASVEAEASVQERNEIVADVLVEADGSVHINDEPHARRRCRTF
jgi:hypothetical protein